MGHCPMKFQYVRDRLRMAAPRILDVGCGNHSPTLTRKWFPGCYYAGADIQRYNNSDEDMAAIDEYFEVGADGTGYSAIPNGNFDLVILNHVVEHMKTPGPVVAELCSKLRPGGYIWIAFPSLKSLSLPSCEDETLHFCDDPTHVRIPDIRETANILLENGVRIVHAGPSREGLLTTLHDVIRFMQRLLIKMVTGKFRGRGMWYLLGFEDHVLGQRIA